jgi:hypothetical protein
VPRRSPTNYHDSALPAPSARLLAFLAILAGGGLGGAIGFASIALQCHGNCTVPNGLGALVGSTIAGLGTAVIAVLGLRAMTEWQSQRKRN